MLDGGKQQLHEWNTCGPSGSNGRSNVETTVELENVPKTRTARDVRPRTRSGSSIRQ
jgi:hypothetical protein